MDKRYFISGSFDERRALLIKAGLKCWELYETQTEQGILVKEQYLDLVLYHLGMKLSGERLLDDHTETFIPTLRKVKSSTKPQVQILHWREDSGHASSRFLRVAEEVLLPALQKQILIYGYEKACNPASIPSPDFHIHIWSSSKGGFNDGNRNRCVTAFGLSMSRELEYWNWFGPSGEGELINNPDNGRPIAEIVGDHLYIFPPIHNRDVCDGVEIFRKILEVAALYFIRDPAERRRLLRERAKAVFIGTCNVIVREVEQESSQIADYEATIVTKKKAIVEGHVRIQAAKQDVRRACLTVEETEVRLGREFDGILKIPKVRRVSIHDGEVEVYTDTIFCRDPRTRKWHEIGKFRIVINFGSSEMPVRFFNQTRRMDAHSSGMHAPHVFSEGNACFGDSKETFLQLRGQHELPALVMYAIRFLESVNVDDRAGSYINVWPEVAESVVSAVSVT